MRARASTRGRVRWAVGTRGAHGSAAHEPACPTHRRGGVNMPSPVSAHARMRAAVDVRKIEKARRLLTTCADAVAMVAAQHRARTSSTVTRRPPAIAPGGCRASWCPALGVDGRGRHGRPVTTLVLYKSLLRGKFNFSEELFPNQAQKLEKISGMFQQNAIRRSRP